MASFLGTTLDDVSHGPSSASGGDGGNNLSGFSSVGNFSPSPQTSSIVLNFLRERGLNPGDDYDWKDDNVALGLLHSHMVELGKMNRQYETQLARLWEAEKAKSQAQATQTPAEGTGPILSTIGGGGVVSLICCLAIERWCR